MKSPKSETQVVLDIHVSATDTGMETVHTALAGCWKTLRTGCVLEERWQNEFSLAVAEVAANIIQHAHAPDPPLVEFSLCFLQASDHLVARFVDSGVVATPPENPVMPSVKMSYEHLGERGRGLALVELTTDRFEYRRTGDGENIWIIEKGFPG